MGKGYQQNGLPDPSRLGGEFQNNLIWNYTKENGIKLKETIPYHSETNAIVERFNRTIQKMGRVALTAANWCPGYWGDAAQWAAYTKNRIPHTSLGGRSPIDVFLGNENPTNRGNLRPFGQKVIAHIYNENNKMLPRGATAYITGYTETYGIYQVISPTGKRFLSKNPVAINEGEDSEETVLPTGPTESPNTQETPKTPKRSVTPTFGTPEGQLLVEASQPIIPEAPKKPLRRSERIEIRER